jgi:hypothetical protein
MANSATTENPVVAEMCVDTWRTREKKEELNVMPFTLPKTGDSKAAVY